MTKTPCNLELTLLSPSDLCPACGHPAKLHMRYPLNVPEHPNHGIFKDLEFPPEHKDYTCKVPMGFTDWNIPIPEPERKELLEEAEKEKNFKPAMFIGAPTEPPTWPEEDTSVDALGEILRKLQRMETLPDPYLQLHLPGMEQETTGSGKKFDGGKLRWDLLPWDAVEGLVKVITFGAAKYDPNNWKQVAGWRWRYYSATVRHLVAWWTGEENDPETGLHHLYHVLCNAAFLAHMDKRVDHE